MIAMHGDCSPGPVERGAARALIRQINVTDSPLLVLIAFLAGWLGAAWVRRYAERLRLVSIPNHRSSHVAPTPHGGGLGIVLAGSVAGLWLAWQWGGGPGWIIPILALTVAIIGLIDDIRHLSARLRFGVQVVVCGVLIGLLGLMSWPEETPVAGLVLEILCGGLLLLVGVWWINLFNFMDGIDGIAGMEALFMLLGAAFLAGAVNPSVTSSASVVWMVAIAAATIGFLMLNWPPARIFMGDVGSTYLAFMIFAFALQTVRDGWLTYPVWLLLGAVFVADATVTLLRRIMAGERWFEAHRSHTYQRLARRFRAHRRVILIILGINLVWLAPLAGLSLMYPEWSWYVVFIAYVPLVIGALVLGAGKRDHV